MSEPEFGPTPSQTAGPYLHIGMGRDRSQATLAGPDARGIRIALTGRLLDGNGEPVDDALLEAWQADAAGIYPHPSDPRAEQADPAFRGFGRCATDGSGRFRFDTVKPGPEGEGRAPFVALHLFARGLNRHLYTRLYFADDAAVAHDPWLAGVPAERRDTLLARPEPNAEGLRYRRDLHLQGERETVFLTPAPGEGGP